MRWIILMLCLMQMKIVHLHMRLEGIMKNNAVKNGQVLDMALYAITRQETQISVRNVSVVCS